MLGSVYVMTLPTLNGASRFRTRDRQSELSQTRNLKMARSAHAYVRGSTVKFYEWLEDSAGKVPTGPPIWICGDCHVGNLGPLADAKGRVAIQIRDLDQTVIGNPAHDLVRLGLSLASAARGSDLPGVTTARILEELMGGYEAALGETSKSPKDRSHRPKAIQLLLAQSVRRRWRNLAAERLETVRPAIPLSRRFWPLSSKERYALIRMVKSDPVRELVVSLNSRDADEPVELLDAAYWVKGCSSLGRLRYAALLRVGTGKGSGLCLIDIKEGVAAAAPRAARARMPRDNAVRIVTGAQALSPNLGQRMLAARLLDRAVSIRELMPQDLKIEVDRLTQQEAMTMARYLAGVVGRAHGRQMDDAKRQQWLSLLAKSRTSSLDAPSWLWSSVVELIALHESAYLDHFRRYALAAAA
jgi:uncharacterized protein (DUF2252 family)